MSVTSFSCCIIVFNLQFVSQLGDSGLMHRSSTIVGSELFYNIIFQMFSNQLLDIV